MIKHYSGYALPRKIEVSYALEYKCPICKSDKVEINESIPARQFCDGGPSTYDAMCTWECDDCGHRDLGEEFIIE
jgi:ribosomal protein L37AE/L43A